MSIDDAAAIILCGGRSSRMGQPKHLLRFGDQTVLERIVLALQKVVSQIVIVASENQKLTNLDGGIQIVHDRDEYQGPLVGLMYGLEAIAGKSSQVYLCGCDTPLIKPPFVEHILRLGKKSEIAVPVEDRFFHPLAASYKTSLLPRVQQLVETGERRPRALITESQSVKIPVEELKAIDSDLDSLRNMNTPEEYQALLAKLAT